MIHPQITTRTCSWTQFTRLYYLDLSTWSHATQEWFLHSNLLSPWSYPIKAQTLEHTKRQFHDASVLVVPSNFYVNWCHWARFPMQLPKAMSKNRCRNEQLRQCRWNNKEGYGRAWPGTGVRAGNDCDLIVVIRPSTARPVNLHVGLAKVFPDATVRLVNYLPSERRLPNNQLFWPTLRHRFSTAVNTRLSHPALYLTVSLQLLVTSLPATFLNSCIHMVACNDCSVLRGVLHFLEKPLTNWQLHLSKDRHARRIQCESCLFSRGRRWK